MTDMTVTASHASDQGAMIAEMARLREENDKLKAKMAAKQQLRCKVSDKGAVSVYGMGRFPVTLYLSQWEALIKFIPEVEAFLVENVAKLSTKPE